MEKYDSKIDKIISLVKNIMHQNQNSSPEKVESPNSQGYDISYIVPASLASFTSSEHNHDPIKWKHVVIIDDSEEYGLSKITKSTSKTNTSKSN